MYNFSKLILKDLNTTPSNCPLITYSCLCTGTKLICKTFHRNTIQAQITIGDTSRQIAFFSRIPMQPSEDFRLPVQFKRKQFQFRLPFAMTINKSLVISYITVGGSVCRSQRHHRSNIPNGEIMV
ncbi:hypothetical protein AMTRI_Chr05g63000 [Amborella trichopoda]